MVSRYPSDIRKVGVKGVYDLSATPFYLSGSGYNEGFIFPWTVSDFSLMDAIESGIVKVPRVPVDDDATGDLVSYLTPVAARRRATAKTQVEGYPLRELAHAGRNLSGALEKSLPELRTRLSAMGGRPWQ